MNIFIDYLPDVIGCLGALIVLIAYTLLQMGRMRPDSFLYSFLNLIAAAMILASLFYAWNLAAALIEVAWIAVSFYGLFKAVKAFLRRCM